MKLVIMTGREKLYESMVKEVVLPGADGEFSVWDFHQPFLYRLKKGYVKAIKPGDLQGEDSASFFIKDGVAKMLGNILTVLVDIGAKAENV